MKISFLLIGIQIPSELALVLLYDLSLQLSSKLINLLLIDRATLPLQSMAFKNT